jgi:hypothetical protein
MRAQAFHTSETSRSLDRNLGGLNPRRGVWLGGALIALATLAAYANSFSGEFIFDDLPSIVDNPTIRHLSDLRQVFSPPRNGETVSERPRSCPVARNRRFWEHWPRPMPRPADSTKPWLALSKPSGWPRPPEIANSSKSFNRD